MNKQEKNLSENRKAYHEYFIEETYEAGLELVGTEVKSVKLGKANLKDSYAEIKNGELFIENMHISPYEQGNIFNRDPLRTRRVLMHKAEIRKLEALVSQKGYTLIPVALYQTRGLIKVRIALAKGKKLYDKREVMAKKVAQREVERSFKESYR
ncbi:MAG TPA: SsrA-binding protein [Clostridiaceae bacterium]|nr:SsrA-binding protein [Clostridiaceae bacterium]HBG88599.1 SsrA-binding protein [Marinilabiliaceae bacterium]HBG39523.1 SsrA-binding protein [Clostridiaceae bacterium]HBN28870.1 SsrA-binding protein [Clostridiaceae bacterium]HBX47317.1 SsrA-binding protein [Clostridiaceae bacterium]